MTARPFVGAVVLYRRDISSPYQAAIVCGSRDRVCDLFVLPCSPGVSPTFIQVVPYSPKGEVGRWTWPADPEKAVDLDG